MSPSSLRDENNKNKAAKKTDKQEKIKAEKEPEESDDDSDSDDDDDENAGINEDLKNAVIKALGSNAANKEDEEDVSDLDDETMLKLDESIAAAFKMKKREKQHQNDVMQYKLRALDFIQELFKSNQRLDLITVIFFEYY